MQPGSRAQGPGGNDAAPREALEHWKTDPDLAVLREPARIAELPEAERPAWRALWGDVEDLLEKARGDRP